MPFLSSNQTYLPSTPHRLCPCSVALNISTVGHCLGMSWTGPILASKIPLHVWGSRPHLTCGSLGPSKSIYQTASSSVQPFLHSSQQCLYFAMNRPFCPSKLPFRTGDLDLHLLHGSLGITISSATYAGLTCVTDLQTDRPRYSVCNNRLHLASAAMQPNKCPLHLKLEGGPGVSRKRVYFILSRDASVSRDSSLLRTETRAKMQINVLTISKQYTGDANSATSPLMLDKLVLPTIPGSCRRLPEVLYVGGPSCVSLRRSSTDDYSKLVICTARPTALHRRRGKRCKQQRPISGQHLPKCGEERAA